MANNLKLVVKFKTWFQKPRAVKLRNRTRRPFKSVDFWKVPPSSTTHFSTCRHFLTTTAPAFGRIAFAVAISKRFHLCKCNLLSNENQHKSICQDVKLYGSHFTPYFFYKIKKLGKIFELLLKEYNYLRSGWWCN